MRQAAAGQGEIAPVDATLDGAGDRSARFFVTAVEEQERDQEAAIVYALDTTEQRALENQLAQQQKMETIGRLAGSVAHDFNNLLGAIMMATDFLLNAHRPTDPSFQDIMQIKQNANRAASLVRQLLAFSRKQTLRPQVLDLGEAVSDLTVLLRRLIGENVQLNVVHGRDLWPVKADIGQFEQSIINLAVNARDAMPDGGRLTLRTANVGADESARFQIQGDAGRRICAGRGGRQRQRHRARNHRQDFRPLLHHQGCRQGHRARASRRCMASSSRAAVTSTWILKLEQGTTFRIFIPRYVAAADDVQTPQLAGDRGAVALPARSPRPMTSSAPQPILPATAPSYWSRTRRACGRSMPAV